MDSPNDLEDDEYFFGSYDAERVSAAAFEADPEEDRPPTEEQLARMARFRRPVAFVVAGMALLSIVALATHGTQPELVAHDGSEVAHGTQREFVAHFGSAVAAPTSTATAAAPPSRISVEPEAWSAFVPEALSAVALEAWSVLVPEASSVASAATPTLAPASAPLDASLAELSMPPDSSRVSAFISALKPMCLRDVASDIALAKPPPTFNSVARFLNVQR